jgi:nanoRNase/pAp phosphatase (c-di-AMP/oligoRNAs hydrolase)
MNEGYRLLTRGDFDGLVCAVLLKELGLIDTIEFVHPKDMQDGRVAVSDRDISANLPYVPGVHLAFDHHHSEMLRLPGTRPGHVIDPEAPSAARVIYRHYGGKARFPQVPEALLAAVDKGDSADFSIAEILEPRGWVLLNHLVDARTGLGRFGSFRCSNEDLLRRLVDYCRDHDIDEILALPDVAERVALYREHSEKAREQILRRARVDGNVVVLDLRDDATIWATNRFTVYALFPEASVSIHVLHGARPSITVFAVGRSIVNRSATVDIGALMLEYGGGGHAGAGTCQVPHDAAERVLAELVARITAEG